MRTRPAPGYGPGVRGHRRNSAVIATDAAPRVTSAYSPRMSAQVVQTRFVPARFRPAWWLRNRHAQTLAGKYLRSGRRLPLARRRVDTPDGDFLDLDFAPEPSPGAPLVVLLHGLEGSTQREYMSLMFRELFDRGLRGVGLNFRGCGGEPNRVPRAYHSGETGDLAHVIARLRRSRPGRPIGAAGFSLGDGSLKARIRAGNRLKSYRAARSALPAFGLDLAGRCRESGKNGSDSGKETPLPHGHGHVRASQPRGRA